MKHKTLLSFCLIFITVFIAASQSIYNLEYNFLSANDSTTYHAFLIRFDDGSGLLRVRYTLSQTNEDEVVELDMEEQPVLESSGSIDSNTIVLKAINPRTIVGDNKIHFTPPVFVFRYDPVTDYFEPKAVSLSETKTVQQPGVYFAAKLMDRAALSKAFVLQFFSEDEDFYADLFNSKTRGLSSVEKNIKLYLLVVADTLDKTIGSSCSKDMKRVVETFSGLTNFLGIKFLPKTISGNEYSKKNVQTAINNLKPSGADIVVFYYSGHGFSLPKQNRPFPSMKLKTLDKGEQDIINNSLNIEDIFNSIKAKKARFNLVLSDCCNGSIYAENSKGSKPGKTKSSGVEWNEDNIRTLFLNKSPMSILMTSAITGQKAASNDDFGGFFSYFFKSSLENYCSKLKKNVTWDLILQDTQKQTIFKAKHTYCEKPYIPENICQQNPGYKIAFGK